MGKLGVAIVLEPYPAFFRPYGALVRHSRTYGGVLKHSLQVRQPFCTERSIMGLRLVEFV